MTRKTILARLRRSAKLIDIHTHVGIEPSMYLRGDFPYCQCGEDLALRLESQKIDAAACFPLLYTSYFRLGAFGKGKFVRDPAGPSAFPYEVENRNLCREVYDAFPQLAGKLLPFAFFDPARRLAEQAAFLKDLASRYPLFGLKTATSYLQSPITALLDRGGCLLDLAAELGIPVTLHTAVLPGDPWANVHAALKVVRARPDVRFGLAHTCRFDRRALDEAAGLPNCFVDVSAFHIHCELARMNHQAVAAKADRFGADYRDHAAALQKIAETYPNTILWGTDTPAHYYKSRFYNDKGEELYIDLSCGPTTEVDEFRKLPASLRRRIGLENNLRYLGAVGGAKGVPAAGTGKENTR